MTQQVAQANDVDVVVCLTETTGSLHRANLCIVGRVIDVTARVMAERAIVGSTVRISYSGILLPNMVLRTGILFRAAIPLNVVNQVLDEIAQGSKEPVLHFSPAILRPMTEPCVRVPLSLLRELRGQEARAETTRRALVRTWSEDRRTGRSPNKA